MKKTSSALVRRPRPLCLALLGLCVIQAQAQSMEPGEWHYWHSDTVQVPNSVPKRQACLDAADVKNPLVLIGDPPTDSDCKVSNIRKRGDTGSDFDLACGGRGKFTASSTLSANRSVLLTQIVPVSGNPPGAKVKYVHGKNLQSCIK